MSNQFETVNFIGKVPLDILLFRRHTHDFEAIHTKGWEKAYLEELYKTLKPGQVVFDIGAEQGEFTAFAAKIVGAENVHIIEPSPSYWPNIKAVWEANFDKPPASCFPGFFSKDMKFIYYDSVPGGWPKQCEGEIFTGTNQIVTHDKKFAEIEQINLDFYCELRNTVPDIIMIDCEGAEVDIVDGAKYTLQEKSPVLFISVHSESAIEMYGRKKQELFDILNRLNYAGTFISEDHEEHWKFEKKKD